MAIMLREHVEEELHEAAWQNDHNMSEIRGLNLF